MGKAERVQVDSRMGNVAQCKDVRRFAQNCCLTCTHGTRNDQQRFRFLDHLGELFTLHASPTGALTPSSRRLCRHPHHLLLCGRLPLRPLPRRALAEGGHRLLRSHKRGKRQCTLDSFGAWPIVRRIRDHRDEGLPEFVTLEPAVQFELNQNQRRSTNGSKSY
jgi:hypothetical protein